MLSFSTLGTVRISGRPGNQMFQYAALRGAAERLGGSFQRPAWLGDEYFDLDEPAGLREPCADREGAEATVLEDAKSLRYDPAFAEIVPGTEFQGYFQFERFFHDPAAVRQWFRFREPVIAGLRGRFAEIDFSKTVSRHLRVGDYLKLARVYHIQDAELDTAALRELFPGSWWDSWLPRARVTNLPNGWTLLVFSDDLSVARDPLGGFPRTRFVEGNADFEDLWLMTQCRHHVIANSSSSWWGAWLGQHESTQTVAPKNWFTDKVELSSKDIYADGWKVV